MFLFGKLSKQGQQNFDLGNIYLGREDYENALKYLNQALITDPESQQVQEAIKEIKDKIKSQRRAIDTSKKMILYTANNINADLLNWYYDNNYIIVSVGFGKGSWAVCFLRNTESVKQRVYIYPQIPEKQIEDGWNDGFYITNACYGQNKWLVVAQKLEGKGHQQWIFSPDFPEGEIDELYARGSQISVCEYGNAWFIVLDENSNLSEQEYEFYDDYPEDEFERLWDEGRFVDRLLYADKKWLIVHSLCELWNVQGLFNRSKFPFAELEKEYEEDASLPSSMTHDGTEWSIIFTSALPGEAEDEYIMAEDEIKNFTIEQARKELEELAGLGNVKEKIDNLISLVKLNRIKKERGLSIPPVSLQMVFTGNPGTGKTTVARIMGKILKALGILKKGHMVEVDRSALVAEYVGQTAVKTNQVIDSAMDGVLFIDEAYSLSKGENDFGQEAIEILLKRMEDSRDRLVVIIAGYTDEIKKFIQSNPGLKSRFNEYFHFEDYTASELLYIFRKMVINAGLQTSSEAGDFAEKYFQFLIKSKDKYFGNARDIRNLLENLIKIQSARLSKEADLSDEQIRTISKEDFIISVKDVYQEEHELTIDEVMHELDGLVGLKNIKEEIRLLTDYIKVEQLRRQKGLPLRPITLHSVFFGAPGTGKTTVARLLGRIFKTLGLLSRGQVQEVSRGDLVAEYVGQTATKTNKAIDEAINGVLFIDEAYSLSNNKGESDFGKEAIETLLKRMEDDRDKFCVIIAGYSDKIDQFINSNPGLKSRFPNYFHFENYTPEELLQIIKSFFETEKFQLETSAEMQLKQVFESQHLSRDGNCGNARDVRNFFEKIKLQQGSRVSRIEDSTLNDLTLITRADVERASELNISHPKHRPS
ncbi:MAG: AAA family ATPase [Ignavibacteria bacterium]|jgi:SpoVK/Ycf46/Vps4 family AAA+-type ATPase|nr:AAA family ATPase [Ignavibacteria bacterium]MCU7502751.1 AAA family ATPase [Ignavibacteria bacterium]MCU7517320.1 AAA family ATPase [Ignavibacteria bacterium]